MNLPFISELHTETRVFRFLYLKDFFIVIFFGSLGLILDSNVHNRLETAFVIFNVAVGLSLVMKSKTNPKKRVYQAILIMLKRDTTVYQHVIGNRKPISMKGEQ